MHFWLFYFSLSPSTKRLTFGMAISTNAENANGNGKDVNTGSVGGGVYPPRPMQRASISKELRAAESKTTDVELASVPMELDVDARDFRKKQVIPYFKDTTNPFAELRFTGFQRLGSGMVCHSNIESHPGSKLIITHRLAYQSLGVIYGDIGTSPLYVYSSTFPTEPSKKDILGAVSLVIWSLTIMVTIKYVCIVLNADDEGEGGTFAVYSLLSRYVRITLHLFLLVC